MTTYIRNPGGVNCGDYSCRICYLPVDGKGTKRRTVPTPSVAAQSPAQARIWLNVPYIEKEGAKALGAKWDASFKRWYAPTKEIEAACKRWAIPRVTPPAPRGVQTSLSLSRGPRTAPILTEIAQPALVAPIAMTPPKEEVRPVREGESFDALMDAIRAAETKPAKPQAEYEMIAPYVSQKAGHA